MFKGGHRPSVAADGLDRSTAPTRHLRDPRAAISVPGPVVGDWTGRAQRRLSQTRRFKVLHSFWLPRPPPAEATTDGRCGTKDFAS